MNPTKDLPVDDRTLDRLVDGELSPDEYAAVLRSLDDRPDGWRRCALAFLEAQAWHSELGTIRREDQPSAAPVVELPQASAAKRWPLLLAVAASFLLAFGLGLAMHPLATTVPQGPVGEPLAADKNTARPDGAMELVDVNPAPGVSIPAASISPSGNVTLVMDHGDGSGGHEVPVPVYDWSPASERWLSREPMTPPPDVRRALQLMGRDVRTQKHFMRVETGDGQTVLIPVQQVDLTPAGGRTYQ